MEQTLLCADPMPSSLLPGGWHRRKNPPTTRGIVFETDQGYVALGLDEQNRLTEAVMPRETAEEAGDALRLSNLRRVEGTEPAQPLIDQIRQYLSGAPTTFEWPLNLSQLTPFQQEALHICATIPFGEMRSYGWIAGEMNRPKSARPVGGAMGVNPIPIVIPCHRVIGSGGHLVGYGGGMTWKVRLLQLEGIAIPE